MKACHGTGIEITDFQTTDTIWQKHISLKSKLAPRSGSSLEAVETHPLKRAIIFF